MQYYLVLIFIDIALSSIFVILIGVLYLLLAPIIIYIFLCAVSLYKMTVSQHQEDMRNQTESTIIVTEQPPSYGSDTHGVPFRNLR